MFLLTLCHVSFFRGCQTGGDGPRAMLAEPGSDCRTRRRSFQAPAPLAFLVLEQWHAHILLTPVTNGMLEATSWSSHVLPEAGSGRGLITPRHSKTNFPLPHYWRLWLIGSDRERMCHYTVDSCTCQCTEKDCGSQTSLATKIGLAGGLWLSSCLLGAKHKVPFPVLMAMIFLPIFMTTI